MIPKAVKDAVRRRADDLCENCRSAGDWRGMTFSHRKSKGSGGKDTEDNIDYLCCPCHLDKWHGGKREEIERGLGIK